MSSLSNSCGLSSESVAPPELVPRARGGCSLTRFGGHGTLGVEGHLDTPPHSLSLSENRRLSQRRDSARAISTTPSHTAVCS